MVAGHQGHLVPTGSLEHLGISGWIDGAVLEFMVMGREAVHGSTSLHGGKLHSPARCVLGRPAGSVPSGVYPHTQSFGLYSACVYAYVRAREVLNRSQPTILKARSPDHCEDFHAPTSLGGHRYSFRDRCFCS
jgi:hypothetical protein